MIRGRIRRGSLLYASAFSALVWFLAAYAQAAGKIDVAITTHLGDRQIFRAGDTVSLLVSLDRDAYLVIIYQDAAGNLIQLLPNPKAGNPRMSAGLFAAIPSAQAPYAFTITAPFGEEHIHVFAASQALPALPGKTLADGTLRLSDTLDAIVTRLRKTAAASGGDYGEAVTTLITQGR